jgi:hypothetical protein
VHDDAPPLTKKTLPPSTGKGVQQGEDRLLRVRACCIEQAACFERAWPKLGQATDELAGGHLRRCDEDCEKTVPCWQRGVCTAVDGKCVAATDVACRNPWASKNEGHCRLKDGACIVWQAMRIVCSRVGALIQVGCRHCVKGRQLTAGELANAPDRLACGSRRHRERRHRMALLQGATATNQQTLPTDST